MKKLLLLLTAALAPALSAHDFWIEPSTFRPKPGAIVDVALRQGEHFVGDAVPRVLDRIEKFIAVDAKGERAIDGMAGFDPAGFVQITAEGAVILGYRTNAKGNEPMEPARFEKYLREEGLEHVIETRKSRGQSLKPGTEIFSRSAKSLLLAGNPKASRYDKPLGFRFEIIPETNPYTTAPDKPLMFRLLFEGQPVKDVLVFALHRQDAKNRLQARSGKDGRVSFELPRPGVWLVKALHMIPAPPQSGVDWESIWASVTFER
jgi:uncharacterized GH25 family protein